MICCRVTEENEYGISSTPYWFCSECGSYIPKSHYKFCPHCGHKFKKLPVKNFTRDEFNKLMRSKLLEIYN